jgi:hypothetical protein
MKYDNIKVGMKLKLRDNLYKPIEGSIITKVDNNRIYYFNKDLGITDWFHICHFESGRVICINNETMRELLE